MARQFQSTVFDDSTVEAATYNWAEGTLIVAFENSLRTYENVSEDDYESFCVAESQTTALSVLGESYTEAAKTNATPEQN